MKALTPSGIPAVSYVVAALCAAGVTAAMDSGIIFGIHGSIPVGALAVVVVGNLAVAVHVAIQHARPRPA